MNIKKPHQGLEEQVPHLHAEQRPADKEGIMTCSRYHC